MSRNSSGAARPCLSPDIMRIGSILCDKKDDEAPFRSRPRRPQSRSESPEAITASPATPASSEDGNIRSNTHPSSTKNVTRPPRPPYTAEQTYFIWYYRTDLGHPWNIVLAEYRRYFNDFIRGVEGLRCKFYRKLKEWDVPKVREQVAGRRSDYIGGYGVVQRTNLRFCWMRREHQQTRRLPQFEVRGPQSLPAPRCVGCVICQGNFPA